MVDIQPQSHNVVNPDGGEPKVVAVHRSDYDGTWCVHLDTQDDGPLRVYVNSAEVYTGRGRS